MPSRRSFPILLLLAALPAGCDRPKPQAPSPPPDAPQKRLQLESLVQLQPNRFTHLAVDPLGNLYWTQESDDGRDVLFVLGAGSELQRATRLSSGNILAQMGSVSDPAPRKPGPTQPAAAPQASGTIQSIGVGIDGKLYFYFTGGVGRVLRVCIGRFDPRDSTIAILADTRGLADATGMGRSLALARGKVLVNGSLVRIWIRHSDASCVLSFDTRRLPSAADVQLSRAMFTVTSSGDSEAIDLTREEYDLSPGESDTLLLTDKRLGRLLRVDGAGRATMAASLVDLPEMLSEPLVDAQKRIMLFAADSPHIDPRLSARPDPANVRCNYPALLTIDADGKFTALDVSDIRAPGAFPVYAMHLRQFARFGRDTYVAYDSTSGQLLRVRVFDKE